jgi:hypothetical protein
MTNNDLNMKGSSKDLENFVKLYAAQYALLPNEDAKKNLDEYILLIIGLETQENKESLKTLYDIEKKKPLEEKVEEIIKSLNIVKVFKDSSGKLLPEGETRGYIQRANPSLVPIFKIVFKKAYGKEY